MSDPRADNSGLEPGDRGMRFLAAFRGVENALRSELNVGGETSFRELIRRSTNRVIRRYFEDLLEFGDLRNAITHRRTDALLATPTERATSLLETIVETLANPPRLDTALSNREVVRCQPSSRVQEAAALMRKGDFSQVPVYSDGAFVALLTSETLTRWMSAELDRHDGMLEDASVHDALTHAEDTENCAFLSRSSTVFEALDLFGKFSDRGKTLDAILVTHDGRPTAPLNIVTIYDVPRLLNQIPGAGGRLIK